MLRVESSNLPNPRPAPRPRRLLPHPVGALRPGASKARHEMLPPRDQDRGSSEELTAVNGAEPSERWSVRLELQDADIAKLYGQGMTRGAVVWKKGMVEWRPLLVTPELTGLLRHTRTPLAPPTQSLPPLPSWVDAPPALPRPPRVPTSTLPPSLEASLVTPTTVAPMAMEVEPPRKARRPVELVAVAVAAFSVAWVAHGALKKKPTDSAAFDAPPAALAAAAPSACEPQKDEHRRDDTQRGATPSSTIPTVSVADLPLAGARGSAVAASYSAAVASRASTRPSSAHTPSGAPARADLLNALGGVARASSSCGERGGPVRVVLTFANSGVARSISVSGSDLPAATRSCIIGAASRARIPAFTGDPVTVSKTL